MPATAVISYGPIPDTIAGISPHRQTQVDARRRRIGSRVGIRGRPRTEPAGMDDASTTLAQRFGEPDESLSATDRAGGQDH